VWTFPRYGQGLKTASQDERWQWQTGRHRRCSQLRQSCRNLSDGILGLPGVDNMTTYKKTLGVILEQREGKYCLNREVKQRK
jgi:hypothetical protein